MTVTRHYFILMLFPLLVFTAVYGQSTNDRSIPATFCLNPEELRLFDLINHYRTERGLPLIELSKSLSYVAQSHVRDLYINQPYDNKKCNMHSWSDQGTWTAFCFPADQTRRKSVWDKPKELTQYPGQAYELVYWTNDPVNPEDVMELWKGIPASAALLLNTGKYAKNNWKVAGISIYKGYAALWIGEARDPETEIRLCQGDSVINTSAAISKPKAETSRQSSGGTGAYYLVFGSYPSLSLAREGQQKLIREGFVDSQIIEKDGKFRTSLNQFETMEAARTAKKKLPSKYSQAWILKD